MAQAPQKALATQSTQQSVQAILEYRKSQLASIIGSDSRVERIIMSGMIAVAEMVGSGECDPVSIARAITQAAMLGIDLSAGLGEGWLIKHGNQCVLYPGYRSWQRAAQASGLDIVAGVVRDGDDFFLSKLPPKISHAPRLECDGDVIGAYAAAYRKASKGELPFSDELLHSVEWCSRKDLDAAHTQSKSPNSPAWSKWEDRMNRKLPLTRLVKDLPVDWTDRTAKKLIEVEEISERGGGYDTDFDAPGDVVAGGSLAPAPRPENAPQGKTQQLLSERKRKVAAHETRESDPVASDTTPEGEDYNYGPPPFDEPQHDLRTGEVYDRKSSATPVTGAKAGF
jgi:phage RecT family recombinase